MNKTNVRFLLGMSLILSMCQLPGVSWGQPGSFDEPDWNATTAREGENRIERKTGSLFLRAQGDDPAAQLAHARQLEAEGASRKAARQYNALVHAWPDAQEAAAAQLAYARLLLEREKHEKAFEEFQYLITYYQGQFPYHAVLRYQREAADAVREKRRGTWLIFPGFQSPERALSLYRQILANGPNWEGVPALRLEMGRIHEDIKQYEEAVDVYEAILVHHGRDPIAKNAIFRKALCLKHIADQHPRDERRLREALSALFAALRAGPGPEQVAEAQEMIDALRTRLEHLAWERAQFYDRIKGNHEAAVVSYRSFLEQFPRSERADWVQERINELEAGEVSREEP